MKLKGRIAVPGDKSISHRALLLSSISRGSSLLEGLNLGLDCQRTIHCLRSLGVVLTKGKEGLLVEGRDLRLSPPSGALHCGDSATTLRLLAGLLAGQKFASVLDGNSSLRSRPMARIVGPLRLMGADLFGAGGSNLAPISVRGGSLKGIFYELPMASAQVKSALLLAGIQAEGTTTILEPLPSRDHTERMLAVAGARIKSEPGRIAVRGGVSLEAQRYRIPGDLSAAAFLVGAAAALPGSELIVENVGLNPTRTGFLDVLKEMGARLEILEVQELQGEKRGTVKVWGGPLQAASLGGELIPRLIDEIPLLAVLATQAEGVTTIRDAQELRYKEADRLAVISGELNKLGAWVQELSDGLVIRGPCLFKGGTVDSHGDHRIALALEIAALFSREPVKVLGSQLADISFPGFPRIKEKLVTG